MFLSRIGNWLSGIFSKARPGLAKFIHDHEAQAVEILSTTAKEFEGIPLNQWRSRAFSNLSAGINAANAHPDTWVSILVDLAHDVMKAQEPVPSQPATPTS